MVRAAARKEKLHELKKGVAEAVADERSDASRHPEAVVGAFTNNEPVEVVGRAEAPTTDNAGADYQHLDGVAIGAPYVAPSGSAHAGAIMQPVKMGAGDVIGVPESRLRSRIPERRGRGRGRSSNHGIPGWRWALAFGKTVAEKARGG